VTRRSTGRVANVTASQGTALPKVTIITPSLNQAAFLTACLESVADQDYPAIEHIVLDGGSTDGSVDILRGWTAHSIIWRSEPDDGQADAINRGVAVATGDVCTWLNSDDVYLDAGAVSAAMEAIQLGADVVTGGGRYIDVAGRRGDPIPVRPERLSRSHIRHVDCVLQPATFIRTEIMRRFPLDTSLNWALDWDLFIRIADVARFVPITREIAGYRVHPASKTFAGVGGRRRELVRVIERYHGRLSAEFLLTYLTVGAYTLSERSPSPIARVLRKLAWWSWLSTNAVTDGRGVPY
jgi:glycosyltransferase involved in cell wall biosynthesis